MTKKYLNPTDQLIYNTVDAMGYDVVSIERFGQNSIRILLDHRFDGVAYLATTDDENYTIPLIQIDDCEKVSKQLTHVLEVETIDYERLEISSAGVNRPLINWIDCVRFEGELAKIELKMMIIERNQKRFQGRLCFLAEEKEKFATYFQLSIEEQNQLPFCMLLTKDGIEHADENTEVLELNWQDVEKGQFIYDWDKAFPNKGKNKNKNKKK